MRVFETPDVRNVAFIGHGHCGKTSLCSAILFTAGLTDRHLNVSDGNTITDFDEEEIARKFTISTSTVAFAWRKTKINLLDTPGYNLFLNDTCATLDVADSGLLLLDGIAGVEVSTEKVWQFAERMKLPCAFIVNKLDRERSSFERASISAQKAFGRVAVPIEMPIGSEKAFRGIIDLIQMRAFQYSPGGNGRGEEIPIPPELSEEAAKGHETLVEAIAEGNDELLEEFFATGTLPVEHIVSGLRQAVQQRRICPVLCASAASNIGSDLLLDFVESILPCPLEGPEHEATRSGRTVSTHVQASGPACVFVFKTAADPFAGRVTYFKVMSGTIRDDTHLLNMRTSADERLAHIASPFGKVLHPEHELRAGDIGAVAKLKDTLTGDTLGDPSNQLIFRPVETPEPSISFAIHAKTRNDEDRLSVALLKMLEEDRSLRFYRDDHTKEFLLAGNGQQHLEIVVNRLKRRFGVEVELKSPKIPYRETIRGTADVQGRHKKQTGGHGQFGDCWIRMEPLPRGGKFQFVNEVFGGAIPKQYVPAVEKGIVEAAQQGFLAGFPVVDFKVTVYDGSYHDVDSSEMAFKLAGRKAFRAAMQQARPALLEPVMQVEVQTPVEFAGDLMSDFNVRRGRVSGMELKESMQSIRALVPMAEMLSYQDDLVAKTQGRASFHMEMDHYEFVPAAQAAKIIEAAKSHLQQGSEDD